MTTPPDPPAAFFDALVMRRAWAIALRFHGDQKYGTRPYREHLVAVALQAWDGFPNEPDLWPAAVLHDVLEDTPATPDVLREEGIDSAVIALVVAVTDRPGKNRRERHRATFPVIAEAGPLAVALKCCDRLANVENCWLTRSSLLFMYQQEYREFRAALWPVDLDGNLARHRLPGLDGAWQKLDTLLGWSPR